MDDDRFRRYIKNIFINIIFIYIKLALIINSKFYISNGYIISTKLIIKLLEGKLLKEGYYVTKIHKGIYLVHPVLYERK